MPLHVVYELLWYFYYYDWEVVEHVVGKSIQFGMTLSQLWGVTVPLQQGRQSYSNVLLYGMQGKERSITNLYPSLVRRYDLSPRCSLPSYFLFNRPNYTESLQKTRERNYETHAFINDLRISINQTCKYNKTTLIYMHIEEVRKLYW